MRAASSDASFRRYYRVKGKGQSYIVMDAPPPMEDVAPFLDINQRLRGAGVHAPEVYASDESQGFLLLEDFGGETFFDSVSQAKRPVDSTYKQALELLVKIQKNTSTQGMPNYAATKLREEMDLFDQWFIAHHFKAELSDRETQALERIKAMLIESAL